MSDLALPLDRYSADTYLNSLGNLVERYTQNKGPVHYKKAAINQSQTTCSSCLKFFSDIGLIEAEKAGVYVPSKPAISFFRKVGDSKEIARKDIKAILDKYEVFAETLFLVKRDSFDLEELSTEVAGQLSLDKTNISSVSKAIEIFSSFGLLEISEKDSIVRPSSDGDNRETKDESNTGTESNESQSVQQSLSVGFDFENAPEIEFPPTRGKPEGLIELAEALSKGGSHSIKSLTDDIDASKRKIQGTTQYAKALGFVKEGDEGYQLTNNGFELSFASDTTEREELFREAISKYSSYRHILQSVLEELVESADSIESPTIEEQLRTTFRFTDNTDNTLKSAINTLLQTIEAAGFGDYVVGRSGASTRIESSSESLQDLQDLVISDRVSESEKESDIKITKSVDRNHSNDASSKIEDFDKGNKDIQNKDSGFSVDYDHGPTIRISEVRIQNFRNIRDTGFIELENVTTLIGKNESGKTSTLEAINSFSQDYDYTKRDLSTSTQDTDSEEKIPIISLRFEVNKLLADEFYPQLAGSTEFPLSITRTKYFDNSYEAQIDATVDADDVELPTPNILYYDSYSLISDQATIEQLENGGRITFKNLLDLGGLSREDFNESPLRRSNAIEQAENRIEDRLNEAWSQKSLKINLEWYDSEQTVHLMIQDQLNPDNAVDERPLTYPSQRSEGFKWFLSFYINLLSESSSSGLESKVLLLDDPAVYLHPEGKRDWLESVNRIGRNDQVVFSSHSPYLIDKRYPSRIRAIEDTPRGGTEIREDIFQSDNHTLEPLRNALGVDLGSSPFVSRRQLLVEGPTEYYAVAAVANYFKQVLDRDLFGWQEVSVMPVRGASNVVGKASWLESEGISYAIMLDSDEAGCEALDRISTHNPDIDEDRVVLLQNATNTEDVVTEDLFDPKLYVSEFNAEYDDFTSELEGEFEPASIEQGEDLSWNVGGIEYNGSRLDNVLVEYLEHSDLSKELQDSRGKIKLRKRQIAERVASRLNRSEVNEDQLKSFNRLFAQLDSAMEISD